MLASKLMTRKSPNGRRTTSKKNKTQKVQATRGGTSGRKTSNKRRTSSRRTSSRRSSSRGTRRSVPRLNISLDLKQKALVVGIVLIFATAILLLSLISPSQGYLTMTLESWLRTLFGWGGVLVPLFMAGGGIYLVLWGMDQPPRLNGWRISGAILLFLVISTFASLIVVNQSNGTLDYMEVARNQQGGGYLGGLLAGLAVTAFDTIGSVFIFLVLGLLGAILVSGVSRRDFGAFLTTTWQGLRTRPEREPVAEQRPLPLGNARQEPVRANRPVRDLPNNEPTPADAIPFAAEPAAPAAEATSAGSRNRRTTPPPPEPAVAADPSAAIGQLDGQLRREPNWQLPVLAEILESGSDQEISHDSIREQVDVIEHTLESFGAPAVVVDINQGPTVTQFGVEPQFLEMRGGKRTKVKVGKIASLADDLALALAAHSVRVQAPVPGKGYVGIEVPNVATALVSLRDLMESNDFRKIKSSIRIGLGQNVAGQPACTDLSKMPHLLVAGTTGSGKSVCVNAIIACLLLENTPEELKFVMVDPKRVELTGYNGIPHLVAPVVVEMDRVIGVLQWAIREMENRYKRFAEIGARNIVEYNKKMGRKKRNKLPFIVIVIDELADLMMLSPEETERGISRLAQMARATGMHMIIATQRPSVDVVTGLIKANFPARIAFAVASSTDSRVILDSTGAERLLGKGDMLFQSPDAAAPVRLQGCYVSEDELERLIDYWKTARRYNLITADEAQPRSLIEERSVALPEGEYEAAPPSRRRISTPPPPAAAEPALEAAPIEEDVELAADAAPDPPELSPEPVPVAPPPVTTATSIEQPPLWEDLVEKEQAEELEDELLDEAIAAVRELNKASTSLLQRRFRIGYTRAARIIDYMEEKGIIGPPTGTSKAREVLAPTPDE